MKKLSISCLAMFAMAAMFVTSCSKEKEENGEKDNNEENAIVTPKYIEQACTIVPITPIKMTDERDMTSIEMSESGKIYVELEDADGRITVYNDTYTYSNKVYKCSGKYIEGTVTEIETLAKVSFQVDLTIVRPNGERVESTATEMVEAMKDNAEPTGDPDVISTWTIRGISIDLKNANDSKESYFKSFTSGDLNEIRAYAEEKGVTFNAEDKEALNKSIECVTFRNEEIKFDYSDGTSDAANWSWKDNDYSEISIELRDENMGNKFLSSDPSVQMNFNKAKGYLNIVLKATIKDKNKTYNASLTLLLQQESEAK